MKKLNKKGFSLVELIIVIAIMVALVAVMAPSFVKYVKSSRDATITNGAESVMEFAKSEFATGALSGDGTIQVKATSGAIDVILADTFTYKDIETGAALTAADFKTACGAEGKTASDLIVTITVSNSTTGNPTFVTATSRASATT